MFSGSRRPRPRSERRRVRGVAKQRPSFLLKFAEGTEDGASDRANPFDRYFDNSDLQSNAFVRMGVPQPSAPICLAATGPPPNRTTRNVTRLPAAAGTNVARATADGRPARVSGARAAAASGPRGRRPGCGGAGPPRRGPFAVATAPTSAGAVDGRARGRGRRRVSVLRGTAPRR